MILHENVSESKQLQEINPAILWKPSCLTGILYVNIIFSKDLLKLFILLDSRFDLTLMFG